MKLTYIPPEDVNGETVVKYQSIDVIPEINRWRSSAIGYVMELNPSFGAIDRFARRYEGYGLEKVFKLASGIFC
ncbi:hypothetical protein LIER_30339 [Lithospermum erythrorhizon]|uniref:Uncharacterized protein n=1 Tax=Lithospermum erythrorhizon TaxID=34254 RepID=A0AAV3RQE0_LITER